MSERRKDWKAQVNWLIAPESATHFWIDKNGKGFFVERFEGRTPHPHNFVNDMHGWAKSHVLCGAGDFHDFDFGDWRETLIKRPVEVEKPFKVGDVVVNTKGNFIGHILSVSDFEFTIYSEQYTEILHSKGLNQIENNIYTFLKEFIEHAPKDRAIAYQKATINDALTDPFEETKEFCRAIEQERFEFEETEKDFPNCRHLVDFITEEEMKEMKEARQRAQRWQMQRDTFIAMYSHPYSDSFKIDVLLEHVENHTNAFFEKFGYSI